MTSITSPVSTIPTDRITFSSSPIGSTITFTLNGTTYPSTAKVSSINTQLTFTAAGDINDAIRFEWDFGDGTKGYGNPVTHTYTIPNPFIRVALRVLDSDGVHKHSSKRMYLKDTSGSPPTVTRF